jgi:hypothetical protein
MKKMICYYVIVAFLALILFTILTSLVGCNPTPTPGPTPNPTNPTQVIIKTVMQQDWLVTIGIIGIGLGVFSFLNGSTKGLQIVAACGTVIAVVLMIQRYALWIAFLMFAVLAGLLIYTVFVNKRGLKELIDGGEKFKAKLKNDCIEGKKAILADFLAAHDNVQSNSTAKIVDAVQAKLVVLPDVEDVPPMPEVKPPKEDSTK